MSKGLSHRGVTCQPGSPQGLCLLYLCHCRKVTNTASQCHWGGMDYRRASWSAGKELSVLSFCHTWAYPHPWHPNCTYSGKVTLCLKAWNHWTAELFYHFSQRNLNQEAVHIVERIQTVNIKSPWFDCLFFYLDKLFKPPTSQFPNM